MEEKAHEQAAGSDGADVAAGTLLLGGDALGKSHQRAAIVGERAQRDELVGPMVAVAYRAELNRGDSLGQKRRRFRTAVAADEFRPLDSAVSE